MAHRIVDVIHEISTSDIRLFVEHGLNNEITFKAQKYLSRAEGIKKVALYLNNHRLKPVFEHLVSVSSVLRRKYQIRIVNNKEEAMLWLID